jgi:hypothetical protein
VNVLSFLSAIFGPSDGPVNSGCFWVIRPRAKRDKTTWKNTVSDNRPIRFVLQYLWDIPPLEKISRLENFLLRYSVILRCRLKPLDIFHQLEVGTFRLDLLYASGGQLVHEVAKNHPIPQDILEFPFRCGLSQHLEDPVEDLGFQFLVAFLEGVLILKSII